MPPLLVAVRRALFAAAFVCFALAAPGAAQSPAIRGLSVQPVSENAEVAAVEEGADLERGRRWVEAIKFYEEASENYPDNEYLKYGLRRSKIHFALERRYTDTSFEAVLLRKNREEAYSLFNEIFEQVRTHYVEPVSVTSYTAHGTESLYLALVNERFVQRNLASADAARIARVRQTLREKYWNKNVEGSGRARAMIQEVCDLARAELGLSETAVILEYVFGGCNSLDDYSNYLTPDRLGDLFGNIEGEFVGLGIEMEAETGKGMLLLNVLPESPAATGGMRSGEYIISINGKDARDMSTDEAARLLKGPSGSSVDLELATNDGQVRRGRFVRKAVTVRSIEAVQVLDRSAGIGYFRMTGFQKTTPAELDAALAQLRSQGMRKLIWDVRGNPGGLLTAAVEVLDRFIDDGVLVATKGRSLDQNWSYSAHRSGTQKDLEVVLLIDENSASASEIVAGAIRDHQRGTIVGRKSYGKWSVQSILQLREGTGLRLTTAKFFSPHGHTYGHIGMRPDIEVASGNRRTGFRSHDVQGLLAEPEVQAAMEVFAGSAITSR